MKSLKMATTKTKVVTTARTSRNMSLRKPDQTSVTKSRRRSTSIAASPPKKRQKRAGTRRKSDRAGHSKAHNTASGKQVTTTIIVGRARRISSTGSSDPSGSSGSGSSGSSGSPQGSKESSAASEQALSSHDPSASSYGNDNIISNIIEYFRGSTRKPSRRKRSSKIIINEPFTELQILRRKRDVHILLKDVGSAPTSPRTVLTPKKKKKTIDRPSVVVESGRRVSENCEQLRLSPRSLRRARLKIFDRTRKHSSSSIVSSRISKKRHSSKVPPRYHSRKPSARGKYDASSHQQIRTGPYTKQGGSPEPGSPNPGGSSVAPEHKANSPQEPRYRIANMGVMNILQFARAQSYSIDIVPASIVHNFHLGDATRAQFVEILNRGHGKTVTGIGPCEQTSSCRDRLDWNKWCFLYRSLKILGDNHEPLSPRNGRRQSNERDAATQSFSDDAILVPLTNSQAEMLNARLHH